MKLFNQPSFCYKPINIAVLNEFYEKIKEYEQSYKTTINGRLVNDALAIEPSVREYLSQDLEVMANIAKEVFDSDDMKMLSFYIPLTLKQDERSVKIGLKIDNSAEGLLLENLSEDIDAIMVSDSVEYIKTDRPLDLIFHENYLDDITMYTCQIAVITNNLFNNLSMEMIAESIKHNPVYNKYILPNKQYSVMQFHVASVSNPNNANDTSALSGMPNYIPFHIVYNDQTKDYSVEPLSDKEWEYFGMRNSLIELLNKSLALAKIRPLQLKLYKKYKQAKETESE